MDPKKGWLEYWVDPKTWTFVGNFEGMYRDFEDPWLCQKRNKSVSRRVALTLLDGRRYDRALDIGCGLGGFTELLRRSLGIGLARGVDVSPTAVAKAQASYPSCEFVVADVAKEPIPGGEQPYDLILLQEVIWYILPQLRDIFDRIAASLAADGALLIEQSFPNAQNFGREYLTSPDMLLSRYLIPAGFKVDIQLREILETESVLLLKLKR